MDNIVKIDVNNESCLTPCTHPTKTASTYRYMFIQNNKGRSDNLNLFISCPRYNKILDTKHKDQTVLLNYIHNKT
uniref:Uncharacterized protein n=1 Tax=Populus trichocarpa TaxID=3694 RepID=A0A2K2BH20_POPTR